MIRTKQDVLALKSRITGWAAGLKPYPSGAHAAISLTLMYLDDAAELAGSRRTHLLRVAREQWRAVVRITGGGA